MIAVKVKLINAMSLPHPKNKKRTVLHLAGEVLDLDDDLAGRVLEYGAGERVTEDGAEISGDAVSDQETTVQRTPEESGQDTGNGPAARNELPTRPSNSATKDTWRSYLVALNEATKKEMDPLEVPEGATRDEMIKIGDQRVADWNED